MKTYLEQAPLATTNGKRIYCVVANYVQAPLTATASSGFNGEYEKLVPNELTRTIAQPPGRVVTQAEHVVSRTRVAMFAAEVQYKLKAGTLAKDKGIQAYLFDYYCEPITTITLLARDSYELNHVYHLLQHASIPVHEFHDFNQPDYGSVDYRVRTAIATEPVYAEDVLGLIDYLPLWTPEENFSKRAK